LFPNLTDTLGTVWSCDLLDVAQPCAKLPQTGLTLPPPKPGNSIANVFSMTTSEAGEPIVGLISAANGAPGAPKLFRYDAAQKQWVAPPIHVAGSNTPAPPPPQAMYRLGRAPDGTIWGGGQWSGVYRSTDGGHSFSFLDESALVAKSAPGIFPTRSGSPNDGALYGLVIAADGTVYFGTETNGVVRTSDGGATWSLLDKDYLNPASGLAAATQAGNVAGVGLAPGGNVVIQGTISGVAPPGIDTGARLFLVNPATQTMEVATGFPDYFFSGQDVHTILTTASGLMIFNSGRNFTPAGQTTNYGNPLTWAVDTGGVYASTDGRAWTLLNAGLTSAGTFMFRSGGPANPAALGDDVYLATTDGKIWRYHAGP
jgi:hypothetical protein